MQYRGFLHFLFLILWFIWEEGCLISGRRSRKAWSLMRQPLQTADKPHQSVCPGHAQSRRDSLMRCAQWADVKKSWFFKKLHRQRSNPCRNSSKSSPGWLFLVNLEKMSVKSSILLTFFLIFSVFYIFEGLPAPRNSILWKFDDKISKINKFCQRRKTSFFSRLQHITPATYHALQRTKRKSKRKPRTFIQSIRGLPTVWAGRHQCLPVLCYFSRISINSSPVMVSFS